MNKISVVISTHNRQDLLKKCLEVLSSQTYPRQQFEIIIVDDGSTDSTEQLVKRWARKQKNLVYFHLKKQGPARARNLGIKKARGEIIAFTDDDCLPKSNWLEQIEKAFQKNPKALAIEGKTLTYANRVSPFTSQIVNTQGKGYQTCNIAYKKKILKKINGLDEQFVYTHCEDVDLALRVLKHGPIIFEPKVVVIHPPRLTSFLQELIRVPRLTAEFYLFLKHPDFFQQKYGQTSLFYQVMFKNSIWARLFHLKFYSHWLKKNPRLYLQFLLRTILEIGFIISLTPKFCYQYQKMKSRMP